MKQRPAHARTLLEGTSVRDSDVNCAAHSIHHCPFGNSTSTENRCSAVMYRQSNKCAGLFHQGHWCLGMLSSCCPEQQHAIWSYCKATALLRSLICLVRYDTKHKRTLPASCHEPNTAELALLCRNHTLARTLVSHQAWCLFLFTMCCSCSALFAASILPVARCSQMLVCSLAFGGLCDMYSHLHMPWEQSW